MASQTSEYTVFEHRHRFSAWAGARAAQRGLKSWRSPLLREAIEACGAMKTLQSDAWPRTAEEVDALHRHWSNGILTHCAGASAPGTYGRAAKLLNVYLKSMLILGPHADTPFARLTHPPVDRILLQTLAKQSAFSAAHRRLWQENEWTALKEAGYFDLIRSFRDEGLDKPAFWHIERYWHLR